MILGLDGVDPDIVALLSGEGKLPNFQRLQQEGAAARLHSSPPLLSPVIWTTIATGRRPTDHGIGNFTTKDPETGEVLPITSSLRRTKALWNIFSEHQRRVSVVGWWATWPAEEVAGEMLSDHLGYHFLMKDEAARGHPTEGVTYPPEVLATIRPMMKGPAELSLPDLEGFVSLDPDEILEPVDFDDELGHFRWALATAQSYADIGLHLWEASQPDLSMVYVEGVDSTSHLFGHLFRQTGLKGELAEQQERFGQAVEAMYGVADDLVGRFMAAMDEDTTLVVLSDHGFKLGELHTDPSMTRDLRRVSEAFHRPEGVLYLYGSGVTPGTTLSRARTLDIAPTVLALAGLPVSDEMPGRVLEDALDSIEVERIATFEDPDGGGLVSQSRERSDIDQAVLDRLEALGYIGSSATKNDRNLATMMLSEGRYEEAIAAFSSFVERDPEDADALRSLGAALAGLGRSEDALEYLDRSLEIDPMNVGTLHNRGVILERMGQHDPAIDSYRSALRYAPNHEPSLQALAKLGVGVTGRTADTEAEKQVAKILRRVPGLVKVGDYETARALLKEAKVLTPNEAIVYQYDANVAYLMGDNDAAIEALERGLKLDPDNLQLQENLRRLRTNR